MFSGNLGCGIQYSMNIEIMHAWIQNYTQVKILKSGVNWWRGHLLQPFWIQPSCWILLCTSDKFKSDIHLSLSRAISLIIRKQILKIVLKMSRLMRKWAYDICKQQSFRWACIPVQSHQKANFAVCFHKQKAIKHPVKGKIPTL